MCLGFLRCFRNIYRTQAEKFTVNHKISRRILSLFKAKSCENLKCPEEGFLNVK